MEKYDFARCVAIMKQLRGPDGCPWDNKQSIDSVLKYLLEETYEAIDAAHEKDWPGLAEELGDTLWEILFLARMAEQEGYFNIDDVLQGLGEKMVRRHPHIFGDEKLDSADQVVDQWQQIKKREKKTETHGGVLAKVPRSLPALLRIDRLSERAAQVGFDWDNHAQVWDKLEEETAELAEAIDQGDKAAIEHEIGDMFIVLSNLARHLGISSEEAGKKAGDRFVRRFASMEQVAAERGETLAGKDIDALEALWQEGKRRLS